MASWHWQHAYRAGQWTAGRCQLWLARHHRSAADSTTPTCPTYNAHTVLADNTNGVTRHTATNYSQQSSTSSSLRSQRGPSRHCTTMSTVDSTPPEVSSRTDGIETEAVKLVAALVRVARITAGLAGSNGSLPSGIWLTSPASWLPRTGISSRTLRSAIDYGLPLLFYCLMNHWGVGDCQRHAICVSL